MFRFNLYQGTATPIQKKNQKINGHAFESTLRHQWLCDKSWFHLSGSVNAYNNDHWDTQNAHTTHEVPLHDQKVGVWLVVAE
jgi:hypothetical protein